MRKEATIHQSAAGELLTLLAAVVIGLAVAMPALDRAQSLRWLSRWQWQPAQRQAWNPYDCCFWEELPGEEFAM